MFNYKQTLLKMERERASLQLQIDKLDQAIAALQALAGSRMRGNVKIAGLWSVRDLGEVGVMFLSSGSNGALRCGRVKFPRSSSAR